ncbi:MAG: MerR family transcriptional regulator [Coriobacteriales bacterium]|jgi:MerR family transcriptional regulator/heat shock protein HspR|nr:MerR family transcriptional regulator [Coriobacteriales bacterium]
MNDRDRPLYMISVAAQLAGMHPQTLRVYESRGLVSPQRSGGNTRLYSQADIEQLVLIAQLTNEGINLTGVTRILDLQARLKRSETRHKKQEQRIDQLQKRLREALKNHEITALARFGPRAIRRWQNGHSMPRSQKPHEN